MEAEEGKKQKRRKRQNMRRKKDEDETSHRDEAVRQHAEGKNKE